MFFGAPVTLELALAPPSLSTLPQLDFTIAKMDLRSDEKLDEQIEDRHCLEDNEQCCSRKAADRKLMFDKKDWVFPSSSTTIHGDCRFLTNLALAETRFDSDLALNYFKSRSEGEAPKQCYITARQRFETVKWMIEVSWCRNCLE